MTANSCTPTVTILRGPGTGELVDARVIDVGVYSPQSIALADLQGDGWLDVIVGGDDNFVSVLLSAGEGEFALPALTYVGNARGLATADMDNDGDIDVVASAYDAIGVLRNDGTGALSTTLYPFGGLLGSGVAVGDLNLDGRPDIAVAATFSDSVFWLLATPDGGYTVAGSARVGGDEVFYNRVDDVAIADFTGDGQSDLVSANYLANNVSLLVGDGAGGFAAPINYPTAYWPTSLEVADFNHDGMLDVGASGDKGNVLSGSDNPNAFVRNDAYKAKIWSERSAVGDLNGDGRPDSVRCDFNGFGRRGVALALNRAGPGHSVASGTGRRRDL